MNNNNATPFVSTSLCYEGECMPVMAAAVATTGQPAAAPYAMDDMDGLYPEIYREVYPLVIEAVNKMIAEGYTPTPEAVSAIVDNIIRNGGLWYEDEEDDGNGMNGTIPAQFEFGRMPFRRRRRGRHNRDTLRDIIRILLLRELFTKRQNRPFSIY